MSDVSGPRSRQTFRSPFAVVIWWLWAAFAAANLIDLAVQGRDHLAVVAVFILLLVTGVVYVTAQRPRIVADDAGLTIVNPLREHRAGWPAVAGIDGTDLLRVRCEWPLGQEAGQQDRTGKRAIYAWAVQTARRRQAMARMRPERRAAGRRPPGGHARPFAAPAPAHDQPPTVADSEHVLAALTALAEQGHWATAGAPAGPPASTWSWPAIAAIVIPALALVISIFALLRFTTPGRTAARAASRCSRPARRP